MFLGRKKVKMFKKIISYYFYLIITTFVFITSPNNASENSSAISIGDKNAKITVKGFSSLTCPHCAHFHNNVFKNLKKILLIKAL